MRQKETVVIVKYFTFLLQNIYLALMKFSTYFVLKSILVIPTDFAFQFMFTHGSLQTRVNGIEKISLNSSVPAPRLM